MQRIDTASNTAVLPTPEPVGTPGFYRAPDDSVQTTVSNDWANLVQEALCRSIEGMGLTLSKTNFNLFAQAMQINLLNYAVATNVSNAYSVTYTQAPILVTGALIPGSKFRIKIPAANTGAATLAVNGGSAINIKRQSGQPLRAGDLPLNKIVDLLFDGTNFLLENVKDWQFQSQLASPGYIVIPTPLAADLIIQWGDTSGNMTNNTQLDVALPVAFPTSALYGSVSWVSTAPTGGITGSFGTSFPSPSTIRIVNNIGVSASATWLAIGF